MADPTDHVSDLIFGRWRSQILHAGVALGVFEAVDVTPTHETEIADWLDIDPELGYRLLRALGSLGLLEESADRSFSVTPAGELLQADHPGSLRGVVLLEEGPTHYALWKHLSDLVRAGEQNAFDREFGRSAFEHREASPEYAAVFNDAMTSYSLMQTEWMLDALASYDFAGISHLCDIGGGHGHLLASILREQPHLEGTVLELPNVVEEEDNLWAPKLGVGDRCTYVAGDMFEAVPAADGYLMKMILHDWNDDECRAILKTIHDSAPTDARLILAEHLVPDEETPHFAKLFDVHMLVWGTGRERTAEEYAGLLADAGWEHVTTWHPSNGLMGAIEGVKT